MYSFNVFKQTRKNNYQNSHFWSITIQVVGAKVVTNARSPGALCYGFVTMATSSEATKAINHLHRTELHGRIIHVEWVSERSILNDCMIVIIMFVANCKISQILWYWEMVVLRKDKMNLGFILPSLQSSNTAIYADVTFGLLPFWR